MAPAHSFVSHHHPIGMSTGVFRESRGDWASLARHGSAASPYAVELSALDESELPGLLSYLETRPSLPFRYVSVHAPTKGRSSDEDRLVAELSRLPQTVRAILTHPDVMEEPGAYARLGWRLCVENMDTRKSAGHRPEELQSIFDVLPEAGFVFDIAHAHDVDPQLALASELLDRFGGRLRHVHLSSLVDGHHVPLTPEDEELFAPYLARCRDVPWILEAMPPHRWPIARRLPEAQPEPAPA